MENIINSILQFLSGTGLLIAQGCVVFFVGSFIVKEIAKLLKIALIKTTNNKTMTNFIVSVLNVVLTFVLIIIVFNVVGISTSGLMELLSACVLALGLSLKDSISHLASGLIIVSTKPFKEGDYVCINGVEGTVKNVKMFNTQIKTVDNRIIIVPNSSVVGNNIINYDSLAIRRVDVQIEVQYGEDVDKCVDVFKKVVESDSRILKTPSSAYVIDTYGDKNLIFVVKAWTKTDKFWDVKYDLMVNLYKAMQENGIKKSFNIVEMNTFEKEQATRKEEKVKGDNK